MLNQALEAFGDLGDDEELGPVDWPTVKTYIASLNNLEGSCEHPHSASKADNNLDPNNLKDIRIRHLNGMYAIYYLNCLCFFYGWSGSLAREINLNAPFYFVSPEEKGILCA